MEHLINNYSPKNDKNKQLRSKKKKNLREALIFLGYFLLGFSEQFRKLEGGRSEY